MVKPSSTLGDHVDAVRLGSIEGIMGKFQCSSDDNFYLLLLSGSDFVCTLHDGIEVRRISKITLLPISMSPLPKTFQINKSSENSTQVLSTLDRPQAAKQQALVQAVQNTFKAASDMMNFKQKPKGSKRFENRILEELEKIFEGEADQFYYAKCGGDLTLWTQRREARRMRGEFCCWEDLKINPRTYWRPLWCRYDDCFVWNHRILQDLVSSALEFLKNEEGLPASLTELESSSPTYLDELKKEEERAETVTHTNTFLLIEDADQRSHLTDSLCALESMLIPVISGFVKQHKLALPIWNVDGRITEEKLDTVTLTIISRRSQYRAGCRYRRRGIDEKGNVANYVETEQVIEVPCDNKIHTLAFLQIRGSVPVFWTQTGIKYKPPIQLHKSLAENLEAFRLHIERPLSKFDRVVVVNLVETAPGRQESKITDAYVRQLLLLNNPNLTYVGFDFHEYCKGFRFGNVAVLLDGVKEIIRDMKYCWQFKDYFMCRQEGVFRVNCVDCLDRTNLVQSVFATAVLESQLRKLGRLPPDVELPTSLARTLQAVWADNGDALSRHYTGTAAMKGDYTRTGYRTVNGLMKDGVSSMSRYYQRFGEIKRQAAMDFLLGYTNSPELRFLRNCSTSDVAAQELSSIEASSLFAAVRSTCLQNDENSFFEFVASTAVMQFRRAEVRAFGILTSKYLHIIRFVDDLLVNKQAHLRIPIQSINHVSLATENALFKQPAPILHIYFKAPKDGSSQQSTHSLSSSNKSNLGEWRSSDDASSESMLPNQSSTVFKRSSPPSETSTITKLEQYRLDLRQAPFRLFNNYLVPVTSVDEAADSLRAICESLTILYQSIDPAINLEATAQPDIKTNGRSMMQQRTTVALPLEYAQPLDEKVCSALNERRESLRPFLMPLRRNRRIRRPQGGRGGCERNRTSEFSPGPRLWAFGNRAASYSSPAQSSEPSTEKGIKKSFDRLFKQSSALVEKVLSNTVGSVKQSGGMYNQLNSSSNGIRNGDRTSLVKTTPVLDEMNDKRQKHSEIPVKVAAIAEPFEGTGDDEEDTSTTTTTSDMNSDSFEQGTDALLSSDIDDIAEVANKPTRHTSFSDLLHELEDAAAVTAGDEDLEQEDDDYECREENEDPTAKLSNDPDATISTNQPSFHGTKKMVKNSRPQSTYSLKDGSEIFRISQRRSGRSSTSEDILFRPRCFSCENIYAKVSKKLSLRRCISDPLITCYLEINKRKVNDVEKRNRMEKKLSLRQLLNKYFENFSTPSINRLRGSSNPPKLVNRLLQRQEENAAAINHERDLICSTTDVIKTQFIVF